MDTFSDFNATSSTLDHCVINGTGSNARLELAKVSDWIQVNSVGPSARSESAMTAIGNDGKLVLFGGFDRGLLEDTWVFDSSSKKWTEKHPANPPPSRCGHVMVSVFNDDKVVMFGGEGLDSGNIFNDTWVYDLSDNQWTLKSPPLAPPARTRAAAAGACNDDKMVLFGGYNYSALFNDTWIYNVDDNYWTQILTYAPSARCRAGMASISTNDKAVLFGGLGSASTLGDTWVFDFSDRQWYKMYPSHSPSAVSFQGMATISNDDKILIFGGTPVTINTLSYDLSENNWFDRNPTHYPPGRYSMAMATPFNLDKTILFGGRNPNGDMLSDTWMYYLSGYAISGEYTSAPFDTGGESDFLMLNWTADVPPGTGLRLQLRTGSSVQDLQSKKFVGPAGTDKDFYTENFTIWYGHNSDRWIQYRAYLNTSDYDRTPAFNEISLSFNRYPQTPDVLFPENGSWTNLTHPSFKWMFNDTDSPMQCGFEWQIGRIPDPARMNYTSGENTSDNASYISEDKLDEGTWYWRVRTQDSDGDWGPFSDYSMVGVDIRPPRPFTPWAQPSDWTNKNCMISFDTKDNLSGIDHYQLYLDGKSTGNQTRPFELPLNISDGTHNITVRAYDRAENFVEGKVKAYTDRTPPEPFTPIVEPSSWSRIDPMLKFTANDTASGIDYYEVKVDDGQFARAASPLMLSGLTNGQHDVIIRAFDRAGNVREANLTVLVDKTKPESLVVTVSPNNWTNATPLVDFYSTDATSDVDYYEVKIDDGPFARQGSPFPPEGLKDGAHTVTVRAYDLAGNYIEGQVQVLMDQTPPDNFTPITEPNSWTKLNPVVSFSTTDDISGIQGYQLRVDDGQFSNAKSPFTLTDLADGEHLITVRAFDVAGNHVDGCVTVRMDRTPPGPVTLVIDKDKLTTSQRTVTLAIAAPDNVSGPDVMCFSNDGTSFTAWEPFASTRNWTLPGGSGDKTVYVKVRDHAGNEAHAASAMITYQPKPPQSPMYAISVLAIAIVLTISIGLLVWRRRLVRQGLKGQKQ